ncbi:MAG TPA: RsmE family RNA methyltransferase [Thermoanaerobaculia bacterium]|nr:RsmE family RNA methyltransferase [Thermoanaerobaculia bacterium]
MKNRYFSAELGAAGSLVELTGDEFHHAKVTRVRSGEEVELFDGKGSCVGARVTDLDTKMIRLLILPGPVDQREAAVELILAMSLIQPEKFEFVLQKGTELGVASFVPLITDRMEIRAERVASRQSRWERIVLEAVKQSGRSRIPKLLPFERFAARIALPGEKIIFDADRPSSANSGFPAGPITLFIGPEGGWSEDELSSAQTYGARFERLGPRRLRAETAAIVATALVGARAGNL